MTGSRFTKHQVPRGARPDAIKGDRVYLIKAVERMRLTYQVRVLTAEAQDRGMRLIIRLPKSARVSSDLRAFVGAQASVSIERAS
jgi:hypothetical protein